MASIKISELTNTSTLTTDDLIPVVNGSETKNISVSDFGKNLAELGELGFTPIVVDSLPTENIKSNTIYLAPSENSNTDNVYDEWLYANGTWEKIGTTGVDLTGYATEEYVDSAISTAITTALESDY